MSRAVDVLLAGVYGLQLIGLALSRSGQREAREWWLQRRPAVVAIWEGQRP